MQFKGKQGGEMSSKEALDLDGSKRNGRPKTVSSAIMANQLKTAEENTQKQSSSGAAAKIKTFEIARQRSDLGIKKSSLQIKRTRSAVTATTVSDDVSSVKLRKLKSDSAKVAANHTKSPTLQLLDAPALPPTKLENKSNDDKSATADSEKDLEINKVKAIRNNADQITTSLPDDDCIDEEEDCEEEEVEKEMDEGVEKTSVDIKDVIITTQEQKPKKGVIEEKKNLLHRKDRSPPITPVSKRTVPAANHARIHPTRAKLNPDHEHGNPSRLQSLADLIMWRDVSRSSFVFGAGSFAIISSAYTKDPNISCISVISYFGLVYLAVSFIFRSLIIRGSVDMDNSNEEYVVGEEEAIWLVKLVLPYVNEFLSKLRALFSGDPATTMKLAILLFVLARCGSSITIWKMTKLGFFGVFILPKLSSSYSSQLAAYGTFWLGRIRDGWESCSHKKAVAFGIFSLLWNVFSVVARIWAMFMLFVAFKYYQNCRIKKEGVQQQVVTERKFTGKLQS